jgi:formamidopyrimidine-DNA glycosylase
MPELPEVETTLRGIKPHILNEKLDRVIIRQPQLRWIVPDSIQYLTGQIVVQLARRGKYIIMTFDDGSRALWHLGMSGSLRIITDASTPKKHDHIDWVFNNKCILRYHDPRRFGSLLHFHTDDIPLLSKLGPEPVVFGKDITEFNGNWLFSKSRLKKLPIKTFIMNSTIVTGVGNIYANESLFLSGIHPCREAGKISKNRYERLAKNIQQVLYKAIDAGGTTLKDFVGSDGKPGYFQQELYAYGRKNLPCLQCQKPLIEIKINTRSTVYCSKCQR